MVDRLDNKYEFKIHRNNLGNYDFCEVLYPVSGSASRPPRLHSIEISRLLLDQWIPDPVKAKRIAWGVLIDHDYSGKNAVVIV